AENSAFSSAPGVARRGLVLFTHKSQIKGDATSQIAPKPERISRLRDTLDPATDALHGLGPGAVIPVKVPLQPLVPRRLAGALL
ncbi:hypothetical protein, partial [Thermomonas sp.]|uniref:hypothetical protein n=1 Tax=Thermomonas sp. TaxID=1971895 RepID=UPI00248871FB